MNREPEYCCVHCGKPMPRELRDGTIRRAYAGAYDDVAFCSDECYFEHEGKDHCADCHDVITVTDECPARIWGDHTRVLRNIGVSCPHSDEPKHRIIAMRESNSDPDTDAEFEWHVGCATCPTYVIASTLADAIKKWKDGEILDMTLYTRYRE